MSRIRRRSVPARASSRARGRGQSIVEFAVVLPVLLALVGVVIDASRLYQIWTNLEAATRDAAQYLARSDKDPYSVDYTWAGEDADEKASYILDTATGIEFSISPSQGALNNCDHPEVTTIYSLDTSWQEGGSAANPLSTAKVMACIPFRTLFAYPFLTTDGAWILRSEREMTLIVGR